MNHEEMYPLTKWNPTFVLENRTRFKKQNEHEIYNVSPISIPNNNPSVLVNKKLLASVAGHVGNRVYYSISKENFITGNINTQGQEMRLLSEDALKMILKDHRHYLPFQAPDKSQYLRIRAFVSNTNANTAIGMTRLMPRQSGALNNASQSGTPSPPIGNMPQPQGNLPRATVNPYSSQMSTRHQTAVANAAGYNQTNALYQNTYPGYAAVMASHGVSQPAQQFTATTQQQNNTGNAILRSGTVIHQVNSYPVHPDVHFKRLPFFDVLSDLLRPSTLMPSTTQRLQDGHYQFHLTPQQATDIASSRDCRQGSKFEYTKQVQMRFCLLETTCEQEDCFPSQLIVKVNNKLAPLPNPVPTNKPGVEPKRPPKPVNITPYIKLSPVVANNIHVQWGVDYGRPFAISVSLVHKRNSSDLLQRLKSRGAKNSDYTRSLIKEKLNEDADSEIATTCLRVSLLCPLGKMRMTTPCRASSCQHLQCFDASLYLQMNERKATWNCPVCDKPAIYDNLVIDGYFQEVLSSSILRNDTNEITLHKDGSWSLTTNEKKVQPVVKKVEEPDDSVTIIGDDVELVESKPKLGNLVKVGAASNKDGGDSTASITATVNRSVVDLTISDSDDDDEPLAKRRATIQQQQQQAQLVQQQQQQQQQAAKPDSTNVKFSGAKRRKLARY